MSDTLPHDWLPAITWTHFLYKQQKEFLASDTWQTWFIGGNGTGKTLVKYLSDTLHMLGMHPRPVGKPPIKIKALVPSFDNVEDVALEKLLEPQRVLFPVPVAPKQLAWINFLEESKALLDGDINKGWILIGPLLPKSMMVRGKRGEYTKEHRGIELKNGSSIWFATSEQGWMSQRGGEQDILSPDEEPDERVFDELKRGLRNAKGGGRITAAMTPPFQAGQGPTWTKEKVVEAALKDPDITAIRACMADNPAITPTFIERFSKGKSQEQIDVQVYGKYPSWGDLVYKEFDDRIFDPKTLEGHLLPEDTELPDSYEVDWVMAFDWHPSKPCAAVWGYIDHDGNAVFYDELDQEWAKGKEISELADAFRQIEGYPHSKRKFRRWQDPSAKTEYKSIVRGFNAWDAFRKCGIITAAGKNRDPDIGINIVKEYLRGNIHDHPRVFFYESMKYTRQYMGNHYWKRGKENPMGKPDPMWSDFPICIRYILQEVGWKHRPGFKRNKWPLNSYQGVEPQRKTIDISHLI